MLRSVESQCLHRLVVFCWLLAWIAIPWPTTSVVWADAAINDYNLAVSLYKQERWPKAAEQFRAFLKAHENHEKSAMARLYLGLTLINQADFKAARDELRKFAKENPQNTNLPQARYRIAECSYLLKDFPTARVELEAYLKDYPKDQLREHALPYLGDTQIGLNDFEAALETFQRAINNYPQGALIDEAKFGRGRALEGLNRFEEAAEQYQAVAKDQNNPFADDAQFRLGKIAYDRKKFADAAARYSELLKSFPQSRFLPQAHLNAGSAYFELGKFAEAAAQFEAASATKSQGVAAGYGLGLSLKSLGQFAKAAEAFKGASEVAGDHPLSEAILFQQALCLRKTGKLAEAKPLFEKVLDRWPQGEFADDSLHALAEQAIDAGDLASAEALLSRFFKDYSDTGLRFHAEIQAGRLELSRAEAGRDRKAAEEIQAHYEAAARRFEGVVRNSKLPLTVNQGRYYLAIAKQRLGLHKQVLEVIAPVIDEIRVQGAKSDFVDALVVQAVSLNEEKNFEEAEKAAVAYLELAPGGEAAPRALQIQAVSAASRGDATAMNAALNRLNRDFAEHSIRAVTTQQLAVLAESNKDWVTAVRMYEALIQLSKRTDAQVYALRDLALLQLRSNQPGQAVNTFGRILKDFPTHRLIHECSYHRAEALRDADKFDASIAAFDELLRKVSPDKPAPAGAEQHPPLQYSYLAGVRAAQLLDEAKRWEPADREYEELIKRFPESQRLDQVLYKWSLVNYKSKKFQRGDDISVRLIKQAPNSEFADNARLNLAESDLEAERLEPARKAFEELLASEKSDPKVKERSLFQLLALAVEQQRWDDVRQLANRFESTFPNSPDRFYAPYSFAEAVVANQKASEQDIEAAREKLSGLRKLKNDPEVNSLEWFDRVWVLLAEIAFRQKQYDEVELIVGELALKPERSPYMYQAEEILGRGYKQQATKLDDARKVFEKVLKDPKAEHTETAAKCQFLIGEIYFLQNKWAEAFLAYQAVYTNYDFPQWQSAALLQSGKCDEQQMQWKDAENTYRLLLAKFPTSDHAKEGKERLGDVLKKLAK